LIVTLSKQQTKSIKKTRLSIKAKRRAQQTKETNWTRGIRSL